MDLVRRPGLWPTVLATRYEWLGRPRPPFGSDRLEVRERSTARLCPDYATPVTRVEPTDAPHLRVLVANEHAERLDVIAGIVGALGHEVIARLIDPQEVGPTTRREHPDVAVVGVGSSSEYALALVARIVREATCPVIAVLHEPDADFVGRAARQGLFGYVTHDSPDELRGQIDIALHRYAEFRDLEGAFGRRAVIERAKGILMERHHVGEREAFDLLRRHSQRVGRKLVDVAQAVTDSHLLLPADDPADVVAVHGGEPVGELEDPAPRAS